MNLAKSIILAAGLILSLASCQSPNAIALKVGTPPESAVSLRAMETRRYDTASYRDVLTAATQTLQDLGFTISESSADVGVLAGSKQRDAVEAGQVAGQVVLTVALAALGSYHNPDWDSEQSIAVTLVVSPVDNSKQVDVRINFDRKVTTKNGMKRAELINDADIYKQFFEKLSSALFLEGHQI